MRILNVVVSLDPLDGGMSERTFQMSRALARIGHDVEILVSDKGLSPERIRAIAPAQVSIVKGVSHRYFVPKTTLGSLRRIVGPADVIHLMGYWSALNAMVFAAHGAKPYVVCPAGSARIYGRSKILKRLYKTVVGERIIKHAARVIAVTEQEKSFLAADEIAEGKIVVMPNAVETIADREIDVANFRGTHDIRRPFVLALGRLNPIKGVDLLLDAYIQSGLAREFDLVFAGPDEGLLSSLSERARSANVASAVRFIGHVDGEMKTQALSAAEFVVVPSRHEAMSIVAIEAGAVGRPVVLTDQCGFDAVQQIGGGFVVPASVDGVCDGITRMAVADRQSMGARMKQFVRDEYTWEAMAKQYERLYQDILGSF